MRLAGFNRTDKKGWCRGCGVPLFVSGFVDDDFLCDSQRADIRRGLTDQQFFDFVRAVGHYHRDRPLGELRFDRGCRFRAFEWWRSTPEWFNRPPLGPRDNSRRPGSGFLFSHVVDRWLKAGAP